MVGGWVRRRAVVPLVARDGVPGPSAPGKFTRPGLFPMQLPSPFEDDSRLVFRWREHGAEFERSWSRREYLELGARGQAARLASDLN